MLPGRSELSKCLDVYRACEAADRTTRRWGGITRCPSRELPSRGRQLRGCGGLADDPPGDQGTAEGARAGRGGELTPISPPPHRRKSDLHEFKHYLLSERVPGGPGRWGGLSIFRSEENFAADLVGANLDQQQRRRYVPRGPCSCRVRTGSGAELSIAPFRSRFLRPLCRTFAVRRH